MEHVVIQAEHLTKEYRLGVRNYHSLRETVLAKWANIFKRDNSDASLDLPKASANQRFLALDDVSFSVQQGDVLGVIGKNGSGKSTLLKLLSRITTPTSGSIRMQGRVASLLEVGTGFHPEMTGRENVYMNGAILGMKKHEIDRKFDEIVAFSGVEQFIDTPVKRYSSGMFVRLAFSVAAHLESDIMLVDEVLAVGDAEFQKKCLGAMQDMGRESGRTILFVSHNMFAVRNLCNRCIQLSHGKLVNSGDTEDVVQAYLQDCSADANRTQMTWPDASKAPQNRYVRLDKVELLNAEGVRTPVLSIGKKCVVKIEFTVRESAPKIGFTLNLNACDGTLIFSSLSNLQTWYEAAQPVGRYCATCEIPANILNNGEYSIGISVYGDGYKELLYTPDILTFSMEDDLICRGDYTSGFGGVIRPALSWHTSSLPGLTEE